MSSIAVDEAQYEDVAAIHRIYNEVIANTTAVYSEQPVSLESRREWLQERFKDGFPVLVARQEGECIAFASFGHFRAWPCYSNTVEHSVHVDASRRGQGVGRLLLEQLVVRASQMKKHVMVAGIDADNGASLHLHAKLGFEEVGHFRQVGRKFDRWLDLVFMQRILAPA